MQNWYELQTFGQTPVIQAVDMISETGNFVFIRNEFGAIQQCAKHSSCRHFFTSKDAALEFYLQECQQKLMALDEKREAIIANMQKLAASTRGEIE